MRRICLCLLVIAACTRPQPAGIPVVATTTIVGDVVAVVGGARVALTVLIPPGADPHLFQPTPREAGLLSKAEIVFINGLGLEEALEDLLATLNPQRVVDLSEGLGLSSPEGLSPHGDDHGMDPHVWLVPGYVAQWAKTIATALGRVDPSHARFYQARADSYATELNALDQWIRAQLEAIPPSRRVLVVDHDAFGHFARHFGPWQVYPLVRSTSSLAEPSPREVAEAIDVVRRTGTPAIFVGLTAPGELAQRVSSDTGTKLVRLATGSLTPPDGPAPTYVDLMRFNVRALVEALGGP